MNRRQRKGDHVREISTGDKVFDYLLTYLLSLKRLDLLLYVEKCEMLRPKLVG